MYYEIMNFKLYFHLYFFNIDISLYNYPPTMQFCTGVDNTIPKGTLSQIICLGLSFNFI